RRMLVSTSWLLAAGKETIRSLLSRMVAYSGGKLAVKQTKFKPKYAAFFNSTHPQLSGIARRGSAAYLCNTCTDHFFRVAGEIFGDFISSGGIRIRAYDER